MEKQAPRRSQHGRLERRRPSKFRTSSPLHPTLLASFGDVVYSVCLSGPNRLLVGTLTVESEKGYPRIPIFHTTVLSVVVASPFS